MATSRALYIEVASLIDRDRLAAIESAKSKHSGKGLRFAASVAAETAIRALAHGLADIFKSDNGNFDRSRFLTACGFNPADDGRAG